MFNKLKLIIAREYLTRVRKKTFILTTILTPIGFLLFFIVIMFLMTAGTDMKKILVIDDSEILDLDNVALASNDQVSFEIKNGSKIKDLIQAFKPSEHDGILYIPKSEVQNKTEIKNLKNLNVVFYCSEQLGINAQNYIQSNIAQRLKTVKLKEYGIEQSTLEKSEIRSSDIQFENKNLDGNIVSEKEISNNRIYVATFLGAIMMFLIYFVIITYGNMVMRSVLEEKTSRVVEIIISSVKPFELMLGKIIGVGAVGLTQFGIWLITIPILNTVVSLFFVNKISKTSIAGQEQLSSSDVETIISTMDELWSFNYFQIIFFFLLFFVAGYILYASIFAAIGAAMGDDWGEGQSLTMVVIIPVILAFYVGIAVIEDPNSSLGVFASIFPLFSPIVMPARVVFEPPLWQILLSITLLVLTCWLFIWLSGRIYRAGILLYGKKTTLREMMKWMFMKE